MKIIGISGSSRDKNTNYMLQKVLEATGQDCELILLKDKNINPCSACKGCYNGGTCIVSDDMREIYRKMLEAEAIIFGSPTYFSNVSGIMKNFIDRCLPFYFSEKLKDKKAAFATVGNFHHLLEFKKDGNCMWHKEETASVKSALRSLEDFADILQMKIVGSVYALHSEPKKYDKQLISLGKKLAT